MNSKGLPSPNKKGRRPTSWLYKYTSWSNIHCLGIYHIAFLGPRFFWETPAFSEKITPAYFPLNPAWFRFRDADDPWLNIILIFLVMEEIPNNHLGCIKPCKWWDKLPTSTGDCQISEPSTVLLGSILLCITHRASSHCLAGFLFSPPQPHPHHHQVPATCYTPPAVKEVLHYSLFNCIAKRPR